jgi:hypothetical protein
MKDIRERLASGEDQLWWTFRFIQAVAEDEGDGTPEENGMVIDCLVRLASADPKWMLSKLRGRGPDEHRYATVLSRRGVVREVLKRLRLEVVDDDAQVRAEMLTCAVRWGRDVGDEELAAASAEAWQELQRVSDTGRDAGWIGTALFATSNADYQAFRDLALARLASMRDFDRSMFLPMAIETAARHKDWPTFEEWVERHAKLPEPMRNDHGAATITTRWE